LYPWNETDLIMVYDLFAMLLNLVCKYFIANLCIYVHQKIGLEFFFCVCVCQVLLSV
jgi:hypothetical protein